MDFAFFPSYSFYQENPLDTFYRKTPLKYLHLIFPDYISDSEINFLYSGDEGERQRNCFSFALSVSKYSIIHGDDGF